MKAENRRKILSNVALLVALGVVSMNQAVADTFVVSPNSYASTDGGNGAALPFDLGDLILNSARYQQVYDATEFSALSGPAEITKILFRPDVVGHAFSSTLSDIRIDLSTTSASAGGLSSTFASNVGADDTIVYGGAAGSSLSLSSSFTGPSGGPKAFDIAINLTTPFLYDPSQGNLLLDVRNFGGGFTTPFDAETTSGSTVSRAATFRTGNVSSSTADFTDSEGLVTEFEFRTPTATPEPSAWLLLGTCVVLALKRIRTV